jgi:type II secretory pathway pseudopilin PulG
MHNNKTRIRSSNGFLLFELMVSLTIVAVAIMGVLFCFNQSVKSFSLANDYERARIIVQNQLDALRLEDRLVPGETLISLEGDDAKYVLKQTITSTSRELLYHVSLLIRWRKGSADEEWEIETLFPSTSPFGSARKAL